MANFNLSNKRNRKKVFNKYDGRCAYCGDHLPDRWHIDHVVPKHLGEFESIKGLNILDHCNPSCRSCNISKNGFRLEVWRTEIEKKIDRMRRDSTNYNILKRFGLIEEIGGPVVFYFEKITDHGIH